MLRSVLLAMIITVLTVSVSLDVLAADKSSEPKYFSESSVNINKIQFKEISQTDLVYKGIADAKEITVMFRKSVKNAKSDDLEDIYSNIDLDVSTSSNIIIIKLNHPKHKSMTKRILKKNEWRTTIEVTGPENVGIDMNAKFSDITVNNTTGKMTGNIEFSDTRINNHTGALKTTINFGELIAEKLAGSFDIEIDFGKADISVVQLTDNSKIDCSFGVTTIDLPANTGVDFNIDKSFGSVDFNIAGDFYDEGKSKHCVLNNGGYNVGLNVEFGEITINNDMPPEVAMAHNVDSSKEKCDELKFESGEILSIDINGTNRMNISEIHSMLNIKEGCSYDRAEVSKAVHGLSRKSRFIKRSNYNIDPAGHLSIRIHEADTHSWDMDGDASFSRVGGVGLGPRLTMKSIVGPLSEVSAGTQYHWGNKEWTYDIMAEKQFFHYNILAFGGTYRRDYETSMDWAIPDEESHVNAFLLGLETDNYFQVEGSTGYISQSLGKMFKIKAEYFEEDFSSLEKSTNWSLFNVNHWKEGNPALGSSSTGKLTGMRYRFDVNTAIKSVRLNATLTAEDTFAEGSTSFADYKRYLGDVAFTVRLPHRQRWKVRMAGGYSDDALPEQKSFRLGGLNTLRGYDFGSVPYAGDDVDGYDYIGGGNRMMLANFDYYTGHDYGMVFFADIGNVWGNTEKVDFKDLKRDIGIGLVFDDDFLQIFDPGDETISTFRINWAVPVGPVAHTSHWTVNFVRTY